jgi:hypothetical protein
VSVATDSLNFVMIKLNADMKLLQARPGTHHNDNEREKKKSDAPGACEETYPGRALGAWAQAQLKRSTRSAWFLDGPGAD